MDVATDAPAANRWKIATVALAVALVAVVASVFVVGSLREVFGLPRLDSCAEAPEEITSVKLDIQGAYLSDMKPVVREQLIKGGLRLARLLNESL